MKRCSTASCRYQLNKIRNEPPQNRVNAKKGCKNIYPPPRTVDERIKLCGNADTKGMVSKNVQSLSEKQPRHVNKDPRRYKSDQSPVDKQKKF